MTLSASSSGAEPSAASVGVHVGVLGAGRNTVAGLDLGAYPSAQIEASYPLGEQLGWAVPLALQGETALSVPVAGRGWAETLTAFRVGVAPDRWTLLLGAQLRLSLIPEAPLQIWPSLSASYRFGEVMASLGIFDRGVGGPARLSIEWRGFGISYLAPVGGELFARLPLHRGLEAEARLWAYGLLDARFLGFTLGLRFSHRPAIVPPTPVAP